MVLVGAVRATLLGIAAKKADDRPQLSQLAPRRAPWGVWAFIVWEMAQNHRGYHEGGRQSYLRQRRDDARPDPVSQAHADQRDEGEPSIRDSHRDNQQHSSMSSHVAAYATVTASPLDTNQLKGK